MRRKDLEFNVGDLVYLKISPMKGVKIFGKKGKLSPQFFGPYEVVKHMGEVSYELNLSSELVAVHPVFHFSMLKKCIGNPSLVVPLERIEVKDNLTYEEIPLEILDRQVRRLRNKEVASVKVLWRNQLVHGATWEDEVDMMAKYPHLFSANLDSAVFLRFTLFHVQLQLHSILISCIPS